MNIKQASEQSGVSAPNIRFYEKEGLFTPHAGRATNYRDYTAGNIRTLKLIRMLRMLDVPLPTIKAVLRGEQPLQQALQAQQTVLEQQAAQLAAAMQFCADLARQAPQADTLDVDACLTRMGKPRPAAGLLLRLAAGLLHAGAGAASEALFLYPAGQHQHPAGVYGGFAGLRRGKGNAFRPDQRGNVPGVFAGRHRV